MKESYHFVGIGGAGMSALARILAADGAHVTGSDKADTATLAALRQQYGIVTHVGHAESNLNGATRVVASAAIPNENPEIQAAKKRGLPIVSRAELLGELMDGYAVSIAVAGTHGKTTTTAMLAQMLVAAGLDPTALVGGEVPAWHSNARRGEGGLFVAEACEAYGSFLSLRPTISIVTNIEADHLDYYKTLDGVVNSFRQFLSQTTDLAVLCADDPVCQKLAKDAGPRVVTYGFSEGADFRAVQNGGHGYVVMQGKTVLGELALGVPGRHNILNALSVVAVGIKLDVPFAKIMEGLAQFAGTGRRFERVGETSMGVLVIDDYAHHPTEIKATLAAAREAFPSRRIVAAFQPHLPSRTQDLMGDFAQAFGDADAVLITDIYLAREKPIEGVSGAILAERVAAVKGADKVRFVADKGDLPRALTQTALPGDLVLTLGAGDIEKVGAAYLATLKEKTSGG